MPMIITGSSNQSNSEITLEEPTIAGVIDAWSILRPNYQEEITLHSTDAQGRRIIGTLVFITTEIELIEFLTRLCFDQALEEEYGGHIEAG